MGDDEGGIKVLVVSRDQPKSVPAELPKPGDLPERIFLVGFMGCGKTTISRLIAHRLGWNHLDLDRMIEDRAGLTIHRIFSIHGERHFRGLEHSILREASTCAPKTIVALGGGAFVGEANREIVRKSGVSVWLDAPFKTLLARVSADKKRPLAQSVDQLYQLFRARLPFYHEADIRIRVGEAAAGRVARDVIRILREDWSVLAERRKLRL